jgi:hypothetical protein
MPQPKKPQPVYGIENAVRDDVQAYCDRTGFHIFAEEFSLLVDTATKPAIFTLPKRFHARIRAFGELYQRAPEHVLEIMLMIRKTLSEQALNMNGRVRQFLLTHSYVNHGSTMFPVDEMTDGEIAEHLSKPGCVVSTESVKTERKKLRRKLHAVKLAQDPDFIDYMRTGNQKTLKKLRARKGTKHA